MTWPLAVMALPGYRVCVPTMKPEAVFPVILVPSTTTTAGAAPVLASAGDEGVGFGGTGLRIIAPPEAAETCCPFTVIAEPGTNV